MLGKFLDVLGPIIMLLGRCPLLYLSGQILVKIIYPSGHADGYGSFKLTTALCRFRSRLHQHRDRKSSVSMATCLFPVESALV